MRRKKSQAWSMDIIFAVVIFIGAFFTFYFLAKPSAQASVEGLQKDAQQVISEVSGTSPVSVIIAGKVNETRLLGLVQQDYADIKRQLRIEGDFCIHFEDQSGNVIYIEKTETENVTGLGSPKINISDIPCS